MQRIMASWSPTLRRSEASIQISRSSRVRSRPVGPVARAASDTGVASARSSLVLTAVDFGRAYLTENWATRFVTELFQEFTIVSIGHIVLRPKASMLEGCDHRGRLVRQA